MFRYRCPHCTKLLQAPELRAGKTTVCSKCSQPLTIPADKGDWLNERGEPLLTSPTVVIRTPAPAAILPPTPREPKGDADNDVLGAIFDGAIHPSSGPNSGNFGMEVSSPAGMSAALSALLGNSDVPIGPPPPEPTVERTVPATAPLPVPPQPVAEETLVPQVEEPRPAPPAEPAPPRPRYPTPMPQSFPRRPSPVAAEAATATAPVATPPPRSPFSTQPQPVGADSGTGWSDSRGPRSRRLVATTPAPPRRPADEEPGVGLSDSGRLRNQLDIAVELTSALTSRMKPPRQPRRDLKLSTALWLLATGVAVALLIETLITTTNRAAAVALLGVLQILGGYAWIVWLAFRRDRQRGLICAFPPAAIWYLAQWKYAKYRPLRFVGTGAVLVLAAGLAGFAVPHTRSWAGVPDGTAIEAEKPPDITTQSKLVQLRYYRDQRSYESLIQLLRTLARTDPSYSDEAKNRVELAADLKALCGHKDSEVKVEAMAAYAQWGGDDARGLCLAATRSTNRDERMMALRLLPRWKDESVARAVAERIGRPGTETTAAQESLIELGGPIAERAAIPLLRNDDQGVRLTAIEILGHEKVGGVEAVAALRDVSRNSADPGTRTPAAAKADLIEGRLKK